MRSGTVAQMLTEVNAFIYPAEKTVLEQKKELQEVVSDIEDVSQSILGVLRELDNSQKVKGDKWQSDFESYTAEANAVFDGIQRLANSQDALFSHTVKKARGYWQAAIDNMRGKLDVVRL